MPRDKKIQSVSSFYISSFRHSFEKETHALEQLIMRDLVFDGGAGDTMDESNSSQVSCIVMYYIVVKFSIV